MRNQVMLKEITERVYRGSVAPKSNTNKIKIFFSCGDLQCLLQRKQDNVIVLC